jgi:hypothetical protein
LGFQFKPAILKNIKKMKVIQFVAIACIALSVCTSFERTGLDLLETQIEEHHEMMREIYGDIELGIFGRGVPRHYKKITKKLLQDTKWVCTNGKDPNTLSKQQYIAEFSSGPCQPTVVVPGIAGSKLVAEIDCKTFKDNNKQAFKDCGWSTCTGFLTPKKEYQIWIPAAFSPMTIASVNQGDKRCFIAMMGFNADDVKNGGTLQPRKGLTIKPYGTSNGTKTKEEGLCGWEAIHNLGLGMTPADDTKGFAAY